MVVIALTTSIVLAAVIVLGFYVSRSAEAHHKPGHGHGNGGTTPPETTIQSWVDNDSTNPIDEDGNGTETTKLTYSVTNADGAQYSLNGGAWIDAGVSPAAITVPANGLESTVQLRATRSSDGAIDSTPAEAKITMCPQAGCSNQPPSGGDNVLVGAGDIASCSSSGDEATAKLLDNIAGTVFAAGDNVYESGTADEFQNCYEPTWGRHKARTRPTPGNHEYNTAGASGYFNYFGAAAGDPNKGYYSYTLGDWHIISLNSMCENVGGCGATSPMVTWLKNDLVSNPKACTLAYFHHPLFSSGEHGNNTKMRPTWDALYAANADVVLNGHDHHYERFAPQSPSGAADSARGIREFVAGMGGGSHYQLGTIKANSQVRNTDTYGVLKLTLHPTSYEWAFVPEAGKSFTDSGTTTCH